jgi:hypothetical protein
LKKKFREILLSILFHFFRKKNSAGVEKFLRPPPTPANLSAPSGSGRNVVAATNNQTHDPEKVP